MSALRTFVVVAMALACSCAAQPAKPAPVRPLAELPESHRALWEAWLARDPDWPSKRARALADPALTEFLVQNLLRVLMGTYDQAGFTTLARERLGSFERARAELIVLDAASVPYLVELMGIADSAMGDLCASILEEIGRPAVVPVTALLGRGNQARMRAADLLGRLPSAGEAEPEVFAALARSLAEDPFWIVRSEAAQSLGQRGTRAAATAPTRAALSAALAADADSGVREAAARALVQLEDPAAIPALIEYLERAMRDSDLRSLQIAQASLRRLSGVQQTLDPAGWRAWWRSNGGLGPP